MRTKLRAILYKISSALVSALYLAATAQCAAGYAFNQIVPDVRQGVAMSGGSACPVRAHQLSGASSISVRWSTTLGANPVAIVTQNQTAAARLTEIEQVISQSLAAWTGVIGTTLLPASVAPLARIATQNACGFRWPQFHLFRSSRYGFHSRRARVPLASLLPTRSANKSAAARLLRSSDRFSTLTFISIPAIR